MIYTALKSLEKQIFLAFIAFRYVSYLNKYALYLYISRHKNVIRVGGFP